MMERAKELREALDSTAAADKDLRSWVLNDIEWEEMSKLMEFLKVCYLYCFLSYCFLSIEIHIYYFRSSHMQPSISAKVNIQHLPHQFQSTTGSWIELKTSIKGPLYQVR
jgi:hypothetical protein